MCFYSIKFYTKCGHESQSKAEHYVFELCKKKKELLKTGTHEPCPEEITVRNTMLLHKRTHGWCPRCQKEHDAKKPLERKMTSDKSLDLFHQSEGS
jgi:hypothetical protein